MLRFRNKMGTERSKEWRCLMCLHVRTGTLLLGSWHLVSINSLKIYAQKTYYIKS